MECIFNNYSESKKTSKKFLFIIILIAIILVFISCKKKEEKLPAPEIRTEQKDNKEITEPNDKKVPGIGATTSAAESSAVKNEDNPDTGSVIISGLVSDESHNPVEGAKVTLSFKKYNIKSYRYERKTLQEVVSGKNGRYNVKTSEKDQLELTAYKKGKSRITYSINVPERNSPGKMKFHIIKNIILKDAFVIKGIVVNSKENPVPGVNITAVQRDVTKLDYGYFYTDTVSDNEGSFCFEDAVSGTVCLKAFSSENGVAALDIISPNDKVKIALNNEQSIFEGHVFRKFTGKPEPGVKISLASVLSNETMDPTKIFELATETDAQGFFRIEKIFPGDYILNVKKKDLFLFNDKNYAYFTRMTFKPSENIIDYIFYMYEGHTIKGKVTEVPSGEPLADVRVKSNYGGECISGADGQYILTGIDGIDGSTYLSAEKKGYAVNYDQNIVPSGLNVELEKEKITATKDIQMIKTVSISGTVENEKGSPVSDAKISREEHGMFSLYTEPVSTDSAGAFAIEVPPDGIYNLHVVAQNYPPTNSQEITVREESVKDIKIILSEAGSVEGVVVDPHDKPVADASIKILQTIRNGSYYTSQCLPDISSTDKDGKFYAADIPPGELDLSAYHQEYAVSEKVKIKILSGEKKTGIKLILRSPHFIAGRVTDKDGNAVDSAHIECNSDDGQMEFFGQAFTDKNGLYKLTCIPKVICNVFAGKSGLPSVSKNQIKVDRDDVDFVLMESGVTMTGNVIDMESGEPIKDFNVECGGMKITKPADQPGVFTCSIVANLNNFINVSLSSDGYAKKSELVMIPQGKEEFLYIFKLDKGVKVFGRLVDKSTQSPVANVPLNLINSGDGIGFNSHTLSINPSKSNQEGYFEYSKVSEGYHTLIINSPVPYVRITHGFSVKSGENTDLGTIELDSGGKIFGKLLDSANKGIPDKEISLQNHFEMEKKCITKQDGTFEFVNLEYQRYNVSVEEFKLNENVELSVEQREKEVNFIAGGGALKATILKDEAGIRVGCWIHKGEDRGFIHLYSDNEGKFECSNLSAGKYNITFQMERVDIEYRAEFEITDGQVTEKTFRFPSGKVQGKVVNASDDPLVAANVILYSKSGKINRQDKVYAKTDASGKFLFDFLSGGKYYVSAVKDGFSLSNSNEVNVPDYGMSNFVVIKLTDNSGGTLVSTVLNVADNKPVPSAWCYIYTESGQIEHNETRDSNGIMKIGAIPTGTYRVQVSANGFSVSEKSVTINSGETTEIIDDLYEAGALRWTMKTDDGKPLANAACRIVSNNPDSIEKPREGSTDQDGKWIVRGLFPGEYTVRASSGDAINITEVIKIQVHQLTGVVTQGNKVTESKIY